MLTAVLALGVGAFAGALAGLVIRGRVTGLGFDVAVGLVGSMAGAWGLVLLGADLAPGGVAGPLPAVLGAFIGATLLTALYHALPHSGLA